MNASVKPEGVETGFDVPAVPGMSEADIESFSLVHDRVETLWPVRARGKSY